MADIEMPQLGETVTEGTITQWFKKVGDVVAADEPLFEVSTDKVDSEVPSPVSGTVTEIIVGEGDTVDVGTVLARVGGAAAEPEAPSAERPPPEPPTPTVPTPPTAAPAVPAPVPASSAEGQESILLSPVVRRLVNEHGLDPSTIVGTGAGGRITRSDVQKVIEAGVPAGAVASAAATTPAPSPTATSSVSAAPPARAGEGDTAVPHARIRKATAEHMVRSLGTAAHVYCTIEVDFEHVDRVRHANKAAFKADEGMSLTYLPFISRAVVDAIRAYPEVNATFAPDELIIHHDVHLGIAVDLDFKGLLVPVITHAGEKRLRAIARDIADLAGRARNKKLSPDELSGGTFTITNPGPFGTTMTLPIINQPQVAILSTDAVKRRPVVVEAADGSEAIAIHSVGFLTLTWDHRAFDGAYAAAFLKRTKDLLETMDWTQELS